MQNYEIFGFIEKELLSYVINIKGIKFNIDDEANGIYYISYMAKDYLDAFALMDEMWNYGIALFYEDANNEIYNIKEFENKFLKDYIKEVAK